MNGKQLFTRQPEGGSMEKHPRELDQHHKEGWWQWQKIDRLGSWKEQLDG